MIMMMICDVCVRCREHSAVEHMCALCVSMRRHPYNGETVCARLRLKEHVRAYVRLLCLCGWTCAQLSGHLDDAHAHGAAGLSTCAHREITFGRRR